MIEGDDAYEGLFTFYRDTESGDVTLSLKPEQLNQEYIYFIHIEDGVVDAGSFRAPTGHALCSLWSGATTRLRLFVRTQRSTLTRRTPFRVPPRQTFLAPFWRCKTLLLRTKKPARF